MILFIAAGLLIAMGAGAEDRPALEDLPTEVITVYGHERETIDREIRRMQEKLEEELRKQYGLADKRDVPGKTLDVGEVSSEAGVLTVFSTPSDAPVYLDGALIGTTPLTTGRVSVGPHLVALKKKGYELQQRLFLMRPLAEVSLEISLDKHYSYRSLMRLGHEDLHYPTRVLGGYGEGILVADGGHGSLRFVPDGAAVGEDWRYPKGMVLTRDGRLVYVADPRHNAVMRLDPSTGATERLVESGLDGPSDVALDHGGNLWIVDSNNCRLLKYGPDGSVVKQVGSKGTHEGAFLHPEAVAIDREGHLYVADWGNSRVQKLDAEGRFVAEMGGFGIGLEKMRFPEDVELDDDGYVLVADSGNDRVLRFRPDGTFVTEVQPLGSETGFLSPCGLWAGDGKVLVVERHRHQVLVLESEWDQEYVPE